jgi:hypothetical protein
MHINWKTDRILSTTADYLLETDAIPPKEEGPQQWGTDINIFLAVSVRGKKSEEISLARRPL